MGSWERRGFTSRKGLGPSEGRRWQEVAAVENQISVWGEEGTQLKPPKCEDSLDLEKCIELKIAQWQSCP